MILQRANILFNKHQLLVVERHLDAMCRTQPFVFMTYRPVMLTESNMDILFKYSKVFEQDRPENNRLLFTLAKDCWAEYKHLASLYDLKLPYRYKFHTYNTTSYQLLLQHPQSCQAALSKDEEMLVAMLA